MNDDILRHAQARVQQDGRIQIPRPMLDRLGWTAGEALVIACGDEGLSLVSIRAQVELVQQKLELLKGTQIAAD